MEAITMLGRMRKLLADDTPEMMKTRTEFMKKVIDHLAEKSKNHKKDTLDSICAAFLKEVYKCGGCDAKVLEAMDATEPASAHNVVKYTEDGEATGVGKSSLINLGFNYPYKLNPSQIRAKTYL